MENKKNTMGSEVVDGYTCKPVKLDPDKPIMYFKTNIFICDGERCSKANKSKELASDLRELLKEMELNVGESRVKITRTNCFGACRFRQVAVVFENTRSNGYHPNNNIWLKHTHQFDREKWRELFQDLSTNKDLIEKYETIPMEECSE